jgi:hypothetical protein
MQDSLRERNELTKENDAPKSLPGKLLAIHINLSCNYEYEYGQEAETSYHR